MCGSPVGDHYPVDGLRNKALALRIFQSFAQRMESPGLALGAEPVPYRGVALEPPAGKAVCHVGSPRSSLAPVGETASVFGETDVEERCSRCRAFSKARIVTFALRRRDSH